MLCVRLTLIKKLGMLIDKAMGVCVCVYLYTQSMAGNMADRAIELCLLQLCLSYPRPS